MPMRLELKPPPTKALMTSVKAWRLPLTPSVCSLSRSNADGSHHEINETHEIDPLHLLKILHFVLLLFRKGLFEHRGNPTEIFEKSSTPLVPSAASAFHFSALSPTRHMSHATCLCFGTGAAALGISWLLASQCYSRNSNS